MKRNGLTLVTILIVTFPLYSQNVSIPDTAFLHALIEEGVDTNEDKQISYDEAKAIISLDVSENGIADMTGIEAFVELDTLYCTDNLLSSLDVSKNVALTEFNCSGNKLSSIDVSNNTALLDLGLGSNDLLSLDVSNNALLEWLTLWYNELTMLDISYNPALKGLYIQDNQISNIDVSSNVGLKYLRCRGNPLTNLDVTNNTLLKKMSIDNMPSLVCVSVWELPFPPEGVEVDTTGSPNVVFQTDNCYEMGLEDYSQNSVSLYPNPTTALVNVETDFPDHYSIEIITINGQQALILEMEGSLNNIDLSSFQKGVYFITIRSKDFVTTRKLIKL